MTQYSPENILIYPKKDSDTDSSENEHVHTYSTIMSGKLEAFLSSMKQLEDALNQEKRKSRKVTADYAHAHSNYERVVRELQTRVRELEIQENKLKFTVSESQNHQEKILHQLREATSEAKKTKTELQHYKAAWVGVLQREKEAKTLIAEYRTNQTKLQELMRSHHLLQQQLHDEKSKFEQIDRHSKSYQRELQNALIRIHSSEAKFNELHKEFQTLSQIKRNADDEIAKLEQSMKERFKWELATEREKVRAEVEKDAALDRERFRELSRKSMQAEIQKAIESDRQQLKSNQEKLVFEVKTLSEALEDSQAEKFQLREQLRSLSDQGVQEVESLRAKLTEAQQALNLANLTHESALNCERQQNQQITERLRLEISTLKQTCDYQQEANEDLQLKLRAYQNQIEQLNRQNLLFQQSAIDRTEEDQSFDTLRSQLAQEQERANALQEALRTEKIQAKEQLGELKKELAALNELKLEFIAAKEVIEFENGRPQMNVEDQELNEIIEDESKIKFILAEPPEFAEMT